MNLSNENDMSKLRYNIYNKRKENKGLSFV